MIFIIPDKLISKASAGMRLMYPDISSNIISSYIEDYLAIVNRPDDIAKLKTMADIKYNTPVFCFNGKLGSEITTKYGFQETVRRDGGVMVNMDSVHKNILALDPSSAHLEEGIKHENVHISQLEKGHLVIDEVGAHWTIKGEEFTMLHQDKLEFEKSLSRSTLPLEERQLLWFENELRKPWEMEAYFPLFQGRWSKVKLKSPKIHSMVLAWGNDHGLL